MILMLDTGCGGHLFWLGDIAGGLEDLLLRILLLELLCGCLTGTGCSGSNDNVVTSTQKPLC